MHPMPIVVMDLNVPDSILAARNPRRAEDCTPCYEVCQVSDGVICVFLSLKRFFCSGGVSSSRWSGDFFRPTCYPHMPRWGQCLMIYSNHEEERARPIYLTGSDELTQGRVRARAAPN